MRAAAAAVLAAALALVLLIAGCGLADAPPDGPVARQVTPAVRDSPAAANVVELRLPVLSRDGAERRAGRITLRLRNLTCSGLETGSAVAIDRHTLITNRHVVEGARELEVNTSDGRTLTVDAARVGTLGDIAIVTVTDEMPVAAELGGAAAPGSAVTAVGYPQGGPLTISHGTVIDHVDGTPLGVEGTVLRTSAEVRPGNSGGPLLDQRGRVAGIVYAIETATGLGLAIPMATVRDLLRRGGTTAAPACA